jgi:hypothetical protein
MRVYKYSMSQCLPIMSHTPYPINPQVCIPAQRHPKPKKPHLHNNQPLHIRLLTPPVKAHDSRDGDSAPQQRDSDFSSAWGALVTFLLDVR